MRRGELRRKNRFGHVILAVLVIALIGLLPTPAKAWLYYSVPPIQGTITDATTGKPIENVVLVVKWKKTVYGPFEPQTVVMKKMYVATDKNGVFRIPAYWSTHVFSTFMAVSWVARHPLYSTVATGIGGEDIDVLMQPGKKMVNEETDVRKYASLGASGEIVFNIKLLSLKEKFKEKPRTEDFRGALDSEFLFEGPKYFSTARQLGLAVNVEAIFKEWDEIAKHFKDAEYIQSSLQLGKDRILEAKQED